MKILRAEVSETQRHLGLGLVLGLVSIGTCVQFMMMPRRAIGASFEPAAAHDGIPIPARRGMVDAHEGSPRSASPAPARTAGPVSRTSRASHLQAADAAGARPAVLTRPASTPRGPQVQGPAETMPAAAGRTPVLHDWVGAEPSSRPQQSEQPLRGGSPARLIGAGRSGSAGGTNSQVPGGQLHDSVPGGGDGRDAGGAPGGTQAVLPTDGTPDPESLDAQMVIVGPSSVLQGETVTFSIVVENVANLSHAPLRLVYDADLLEFVSAEEGTLLSSGGAATQFLASESATPGLMDIAISRMSPATGVTGSGSLCSVTFLARAAGGSPIVTLGSRLLDARGRSVSFRRNDSYVAIK